MKKYLLLFVTILVVLKTYMVIRMSVSSERGFYNVLNRILTFSVLHNIVLAIYTN